MSQTQVEIETRVGAKPWGCMRRFYHTRKTTEPFSHLKTIICNNMEKHWIKHAAALLHFGVE